MATWINRLREKGRKLVAALIAALIFIALACGWILPPPIYHPSTPPTGAVTYVDLYVDGFNADSAGGHDEWTKEGNSPYLSDAEGDNPSNYIHDDGGGDEEGNFTFEDLPSEATSIVSVTLYIRIISCDSGYYPIRPYVWNGSSWIECSGQYAGSWTWKSENITGKADWTVDMINGFQVYFQDGIYDLGSYGYYYGVDCAYIRVYYQYAATPECTDVEWSSTAIGQQCIFSSYWTGQNLDKGIFSWNGTGSWVNDTITDPWTGTPDSGWFNVTKTLPDTVGNVVSFRFYVNNSQGWGDSGIYNFTLTYPDYSETQTLKAVNVANLEPHEWIQVLDNAQFKSNTAGWVQHTFTGHYGKYVKFNSIYSEYGADIKGYEVEVQVSGSSWISPTEVTEYCGGTNINNLIDGDTGTYWEHLTSHAHYFVVKFTTIHLISGVRWYCGGDSSSNITADVWVDRSWHGTGVSPYVNDTDYPNNYIQTQEDDAESGNFTFEQLSNWKYRWLEHVYLHINFTKTVASSNLTVYYYFDTWRKVTYSNSSVNTWICVDIDLPLIWNQTKVNSIQVKIKTQGTGTFKIDYMTIKVVGWTLANRIRFYLDTPNLINWTENYFGLLFNKQSISDMENYVDNLANQQDWKNVLIWSARLKKLGVERETAIKKVPTAVNHILNIIESEGKVVVFAHHKEVIHDIVNGLKNKYKGVIITGDTPQKNRQRLVELFQNDIKTKFFIGSIKAAGIGITLTAARVVVFVELDWSPGIVIQAEDRIHRIGQKESCLIQYLVYRSSIDGHIAKMLVDKEKIINAALNQEHLPITDTPFMSGYKQDFLDLSVPNL